MKDETTPHRPRLQLRIKWLMIAVAVAAGVFALPGPLVEILGRVALAPTILIGIPAALAPRGRRRDVAAWATILLPLGILLWLGLVRTVVLRQPLSMIKRQSLGTWLLLESPLFWLLGVFFLVPLLLALRCVAGVGETTRTGRWGSAPKVVGIVVVMAATYLTLSFDPLRLRN